MARAHFLRFAPRTFLRTCHATREELGRAGEELAARSLMSAGWRVRGRRLQTPACEVDLWVTRASIAMVVEVKTGRLRRLPPLHARASSDVPSEGWDLRWRPGASLGLAQCRRLFRAARLLARSRAAEARVGLIEVFVSRDGRTIHVNEPHPVLEPGPRPYTRTFL